jgi:hypothetical protein
VTFVLLAAAASKLSTAVLLPLGFRIAATIAGVLAGMATPFYLLGLQASRSAGRRALRSGDSIALSGPDR